MVRCYHRGGLALILGCTPPAGAGAQTLDYATLAQAMGEPVTISVTGKPQRASEAPADISIITQDDIARSPARDVPGLLQMYAGVEINRWTAGQSDIAIRGGVQTYSARLLVLVNGRQVYLDHYGVTNWNLLGVRLDEIQQIELVRGPASALYGFNAASGVVNIITKDSLSQRSLTATAEGGTHGQLRLGATAIVPLGSSMGLRLSGGHAQEDERTVPSDIFSGPTLPVRTDFISASLAGMVSPGTRIEVSGGHDFNRQLEFLPTQLLSQQNYKADNLGIRADHDTSWGSLSARSYVNWLDASYVFRLAGAGVQTAFHNQTAVVNGDALVRLNTRDTLRIGGEYRDNWIEAGRSLYSRRVGYSVGAANAMLDLHPSDKVSTTLAARVDRLSLYQDGDPVLPAANLPVDYRRRITTISFNAALQVLLSPGTRLRFNGGRGIQSPSLTDFGARVQGPVPIPTPYPLIAAGDPRIAPAIVWSGEIGVVQDLGSSWKLSVAAFFNRVENAISAPSSVVQPELSLVGGPSLVVRFVNAGHFDSEGVQAGLTRLVGSLNLQLNYTFVHIDQNISAAVALAPMATTPEHSVNGSATYDNGHWLAAADARYISSTRQLIYPTLGSLELIPVSNGFGIDAKVGIYVKRAVIYLAGQNLNYSRGIAGSPISADRRLRAGIDFRL